MSTRSGKRIRGSVNNENTINMVEENVVKSARRSRSKHLKENCGEILQKTKRRDNYVTYPTDDEVVESDASVTTKTSVKPSKKSRKNALKEHDINITMQSHTEQFDSDIDTKKPIRVTRRTRKFTDNNTEEATANEEENTVINKVVINGKIKKSKKKDKHGITENESGEVSKSVSKKSKKQKKKIVKQTSLIIVEDTQPEKSVLNKSNTDIDSFHSAAGSPENGKNIQNTWTDLPELSLKINTTFGKDIKNSKLIKSPKLTPEIIESPENRLERITIINNSINQSSGKGHGKKKGQVINKHSLDRLNVTLDTTSEMNNVTYDKVDHNSVLEFDKPNTTFEKQYNYEKSQYTTSSPSKDIPSKSLNSTFEMVPISRVSDIKPMDTTYEKEDNINTVNIAFDKTETRKHNSGDGELSLITLDSSEGAINTSNCKSVENSQISITNVQLMSKNLINNTAVLIESSIDSLISNDTSKLSRTPSSKNSVQTVPTPLKREGTFTKDEPEAAGFNSPKAKVSIEKTPTKQTLVATPGCTPFHSTRQTKQDKKSIFNLTRSLEKPGRRSSVAELPPRMTKVMFCSPLNNPTIGTDKKMKEIKSSLKGSNKSFVFEIEESSPAVSRKRSRTQGDQDTTAGKRKRLAAGMQQAVDRLSRPRTSSANAKLFQSTTPSKKIVTPSKPKTEENRPARSKLPNFALLHQRQFQKMESLDECQERKAKRAKQLLTPLGTLAVLEKSTSKSPSADSTSTIDKDTTKKLDTPKKTIHPINTNKTTTTTEPLKPGYTRFGFKLNLNINPFSIPSKAPEVNEPIALKRERTATLPSLSGLTSSRKEIAKQTILREKSFTLLSDKRNMKRKENRTIIKGVRTNRRFELQMKMRNGES